MKPRRDQRGTIPAESRDPDLVSSRTQVKRFTLRLGLTHPRGIERSRAPPPVFLTRYAGSPRRVASLTACVHFHSFSGAHPLASSPSPRDEGGLAQKLKRSRGYVARYGREPGSLLPFNILASPLAALPLAASTCALAFGFRSASFRLGSAR